MDAALSVALGAIWALFPAIEAQRLEGTWLLISQESYRKTVVISPSGTTTISPKPGPQPPAVECTLILCKGSFLIKVLGEDVFKGRYTINAFAMPKAIDFVLKPPDGEDTITVKAIYTTEGEKLKFCVPAAGLSRPRAFVAEPKGDNTLLTLKRQTKKPE